MLYAVLLEDNPQLAADARRQHMPAHLAFLARHAARIKAAGPLQDRDGGPAGGLWLVEAESAGLVEALVEEDPFFATGLRRTIRILCWSRVFADGMRQP
jgi:uncharacterized protein YciI